MYGICGEAHSHPHRHTHTKKPFSIKLYNTQVESTVRYIQIWFVASISYIYICMYTMAGYIESAVSCWNDDNIAYINKNRFTCQKCAVIILLFVFFSKIISMKSNFAFSQIRLSKMCFLSSFMIFIILYRWDKFLLCVLLVFLGSFKSRTIFEITFIFYAFYFEFSFYFMDLLQSFFSTILWQYTKSKMKGARGEMKTQIYIIRLSHPFPLHTYSEICHAILLLHHNSYI